jgi:1,4-dihydroxy-2-naphthoyl-CoA synthase
MTLTTVLYGLADGVATITLNRPESRNALNRAMCEDIVAARSASCWCAGRGRYSAPAPTSRSART